MERKFLGLTMADVMRLAYQLAVRNGITNKFYKRNEKTGYNVSNVSDGCKHFVLVWRKILFVSLVRDKHCIVLSLYPLYFFVFCNYYYYY